MSEPEVYFYGKVTSIAAYRHLDTDRHPFFVFSARINSDFECQDATYYVDLQPDDRNDLAIAQATVSIVAAALTSQVNLQIFLKKDSKLSGEVDWVQTDYYGKN